MIEKHTYYFDFKIGILNLNLWSKYVEFENIYWTDEMTRQLMGTVEGPKSYNWSTANVNLSSFIVPPCGREYVTMYQFSRKHCSLLSFLEAKWGKYEKLTLPAGSHSPCSVPSIQGTWQWMTLIYLLWIRMFYLSWRISDIWTNIIFSLWRWSNNV